MTDDAKNLLTIVLAVVVGAIVYWLYYSWIISSNLTTKVSFVGVCGLLAGIAVCRIIAILCS